MTLNTIASFSRFTNCWAKMGPIGVISNFKEKLLLQRIRLQFWVNPSCCQEYRPENFTIAPRSKNVYSRRGLTEYWRSKVQGDWIFSLSGGAIKIRSGREIGSPGRALDTWSLWLLLFLWTNWRSDKKRALVRSTSTKTKFVPKFERVSFLSQNALTTKQLKVGRHRFTDETRVFYTLHYNEGGPGYNKEIRRIKSLRDIKNWN